MLENLKTAILPKLGRLPSQASKTEAWLHSVISRPADS